MILDRICLFSAALLLALLAKSAVADAILDQSHIPDPNEQTFSIIQNADHAQTFTVGITGKLTRVDIEVERREATTDPLFFDVRRTSGGVPIEPNSGASVLAQVTLDASSIPVDFSFVSVDLSSFDISVSDGELLAIALRTDSTTFLAYGWHGTARDPDAYARGGSFLRTPGSVVWGPASLVTDMGFRTYVNAIPEPTSLILVWPFVVTLLGCRRRQA